MNFARNTSGQSFGHNLGVSLHKAGSQGVSYLKCLLDLLTGRSTNVFF